MRAVLRIALLLFGLLLWLALPSERGRRAPEAHRVRASVTAPIPLERAAVASAEPAAASRNEPAPRLVPATHAALPAGRLVSGRVRTAAGDPVAGLDLCLEGSPAGPIATTDSGGEFHLRSPDGSARIVPRSSEMVLLATHADEELLLVVGPGVDLGGIVLDADGVPVPGATVLAAVDLERLVAFPEALDGVVLARRSTKSAADGAFVLARVPGEACATVRAFHGSYGAAAVPSPSIDRLDLVLVLAGPVTPAVEGVVLSARGDAVSGAFVRLGDRLTTSDVDGSFLLRCPDASAEDDLVAAHVVEGLAREEDFGARFAGGTAESASVELRLREPAGSVSGTLVDAHGRALEGWRVSVADDRPTPLEVCATDSGGRFRLRGDFGPHAIRLEAWGKAEHRTLLSPPIEVGTESFRWVLDPPSFRPRARGRVLTRDGSPRSDVRVAVRALPETGRPAPETEVRRTDSDGAFELAYAPAGRLLLRFSGTGVVDRAITVEEDAPLPATVELLASVECVVTAPDVEPGPWWLELRDADDVPLPLRAVLRDEPPATRLSLDAGSSLRLTTGETARVAVLVGARGELRRRPVELLPAQLATIRF